jgi:hypothetical protein
MPAKAFYQLTRYNEYEAISHAGYKERFFLPSLLDGESLKFSHYGGAKLTLIRELVQFPLETQKTENPELFPAKPSQNWQISLNGNTLTVTVPTSSTT